MIKDNITIEGMHCASCASIISKNLKKEDGVLSSEVNFATGKAVVEFDESKIKLDKIKKVVKDSGYGVAEQTGEIDADAEKEERLLKIKVLLSIILTLPVFVRMFWMWEIPGSFLGVSFTDWVQHDIAFIVVFILGFSFHVNFFKGLFRRQLGMDALISIGTLSAYFYSLWAMFNAGHIYFESAATITTLILLGRLLEMKTKNRASSAMRKLLELGVKRATVLEGVSEVEKQIDKVVVGDVLVVRPGEKIPLDAEVLEGKSMVNEAMLSGESLPVLKTSGSEVYGATINQNGILKIKVTKGSDETMLAKIIETVESAQGAKPPMQRLADKIAAIFVPVVISISFLTFIGWYFATGDFATSLINAVAVLIISCPCALGIATPIAVMVGGSVGARNGILIKNGEVFESARNIDYVLFDKTGTLTRGEPVVESLLVNADCKLDEDVIVLDASSVAANSNHPLSHAVLKYSEKRKQKVLAVSDFSEISGQGVSAVISASTNKIFLGNLELIKNNVSDAIWAEKMLDERNGSSGTVLFVADDKKVFGAFIINDEIRGTSAEAVGYLSELGIKSVMISGDNESNTKIIAEKIGINEYYAGVLPHEKQSKVKQFQQGGKRVVFVGDGINDAPSLVQADLGIAVATGTDIAKESGGIVLMQSDPLKVVEAIQLSRKTFSVIKQNLFWAFFYNILAIPLAAAGFVNPMFGALAMGLSDVFVIGNSLRIYKK